MPILFLSVWKVCFFFRFVYFHRLPDLAKLVLDISTDLSSMTFPFHYRLFFRKFKSFSSINILLIFVLVSLETESHFKINEGLCTPRKLIKVLK